MAEAWANIVALYALEGILSPESIRIRSEYQCSDLIPEYKQRGTYTDFLGYNFIATCFLLEFHNRYGDTFFNRFFTSFYSLSEEQMNALRLHNSEDDFVFKWLAQQFSLAAGQDVEQIFREYHLPGFP